MDQGRPGDSSIRLAELVAALSVATDLAMSQPLEYALRSCIVAVRLADALGFDDNGLHAVYYQALLRYIGCNAETLTMAALVGDEMAIRQGFSTIDPGRQKDVIGLLLRTIRQSNSGASAVQMVRAVARGLLGSTQFNEAFAGHCEVAQRLAARLGFDSGIVLALGQLYERWDGKGQPNGLKGDQIAPSVLVVTLAQDAVTFHRLGGVDAAVAIARERNGTAYSPGMVERFCEKANSLLAGIEDDPAWDGVIDLEPGQGRSLSAAEFDNACLAIADFADLKSPFLLRHSAAVAELGAAAARHCRLPEGDAVSIRRAGMLHDVGRIGISAGIWGKPGPLSEREWEQVRLHPYHTARVFAHPPALAKLGALASLHNERLDGSGYHRAIPGALLSPAARILAAADVYQAMTEGRPHRPAHTADAAADQLRRDARAGRLDGDAVDGVLAAAGHRPRSPRTDFVSGLSPREIEVLRLLAQANSIKQIARLLYVSEKTIDNHVQHIYAKIGVSTRAGATLFAMEHGLLFDAD
jgi:HD-GYP domain-containing protein (c-di-GMP phosphodiesterase class II)